MLTKGMVTRVTKGQWYVLTLLLKAADGRARPLRVGQQQLGQNLRLPYWSISAAGDFKQLDSLIEHLKMLPFMAECTKPFYNHPGM